MYEAIQHLRNVRKLTEEAPGYDEFRLRCIRLYVRIIFGDKLQADEMRLWEALKAFLEGDKTPLRNYDEG